MSKKISLIGHLILREKKPVTEGPAFRSPGISGFLREDVSSGSSL